MAAVVVTAANTNTRINDSDSNTNWSNFPAGGPAPSSEPQLRYQYSGTGSVGAVNKKITATASLAGFAYTHGSVTNMENAANKLWLFKGYVADFGDLNATFGLKAALGNDVSNHYYYNMAGSGANRAVFDTYPAQGGYLIAAIDPNIAAWREGTTGTMANLQNVDYFGIQAQFVAGGAKAENLALDAIDVGTGLQIYGGDGVSADAVFQDLVDADQGTIANRWGYVTQASGAIFIRGMMEIGVNNVTSTATEFTDDSGTTVFFPDGYHSAGLFGLTIDLGSASTVIDIGSNLIGQGTITSEDTRPDHIVTGTSGSYTFSGQLLNHRNITLTSAVDFDGATIECQLLTQATAEIQNATVRTDALTSVAALQDPTFGSTTGLHDTTFEQIGAGHAIEIDTAGSYTLTNLFFTGYGADTTDSAAIDITASTGTVTLTVSGGDVPTYKTAGATVVIVTSPVTTTITCQDINTGSPIQGVAVTVKAETTGPLPYKDSVTITQTGGTATVSHTAHGFGVGQKVEIEGADQNNYNRIKTILTVPGANSYTFAVDSGTVSPATGTITATAILIDELTNASGVVSDTRAISSDQDVSGYAAKGTGLDLYKRTPISTTIDSASGVSNTVLMQPD